jgi:hypothetical protein
MLNEFAFKFCIFAYSRRFRLASRVPHDHLIPSNYHTCFTSPFLLPSLSKTTYLLLTLGFKRLLHIANIFQPQLTFTTLLATVQTPQPQNLSPTILKTSFTTHLDSQPLHIFLLFSNPAARCAPKSPSFHFTSLYFPRMHRSVPGCTLQYFQRAVCSDLPPVGPFGGRLSRQDYRGEVFRAGSVGWKARKHMMMIVICTLRVRFAT